MTAKKIKHDDLALDMAALGSAELVRRLFDAGEPNAAALVLLAREVAYVERALNRLGLNGASTPFGALEALAKEVKDGLERLASAVDALPSGGP